MGGAVCPFIFAPIVTPLATGIARLAREQEKAMEVGLRTFSTHLDLNHLVRCAVAVVSASHAAGVGQSKLAVKVDGVSGYR